jgi:hypothetical protein
MVNKLHFLIMVLALVFCVTGQQPSLAGEDAAEGYVAPDTDFQWVTSGGSITQITTGLRYTHHHWYGEFNIGGFSAFDNRENAFFLGVNLGRRFQLIPRLFLGVDLGYRHIIPDGSDDPAIDTGKYFSLEGRLKLEVVLGKHFSTFLGAGTTNIYQGYSLGDDTVHKGSIFWGVGLL